MIQEAVRPSSIEEAVSLNEQGMMFLSGGTLINWAPAGIDTEKVILLEGLIPNSIEKKGEKVEIGAGATLQSIADSSLVPEALKVGAGFIPSRNIRNMATIGGNIGANRPDSYVLPVLFALGAELVTAGGEVVSVYDYSALRRSDLIVKVLLPQVEGNVVVDRALRSSAAYPAAITAVRVSGNDCVIALGCASETVIRLRDLEKEISEGKISTEEEVFKAVYGSINPPPSLKESAGYKKYIASTLIARSVILCKEGL